MNPKYIVSNVRKKCNLYNEAAEVGQLYYIANMLFTYSYRLVSDTQAQNLLRWVAEGSPGTFQ